MPLQLDQLGCSQSMVQWKGCCERVVRGVVRGAVQGEEEGCGEGVFVCWSAEWVLIHPAHLFAITSYLK